MSNPYTARATDLIRWRFRENIAGAECTLPPMPHSIDEAQVNATLALAYEQRTANLIALCSLSQNMVHERHDAAPVNGAQFEALAQEIKERLEL